MDPNANLKEALGLASAMIRAYDDCDGPESNGIDQDDAMRLAELVKALHEWIRKGGSLPSVWQK